MKTIYLIIVMSLFASCSKRYDLQTVSSVDLKKYAGLWYEIALYPNSFEKDCYCTTAEYQTTDKKYIKVINRCRKQGIDGSENKIEGKAFVVKNSNNAKLKVQFFWPFKGDYWIIDLAQDYSYAVVSEPTKKYLWILSREPQMPDTTYNQIIERLQDKKFDISKIQKTVHCKQ